MTVIMFTDIEASTEASHALGDEAAHQFIRTHNEIVRKALRECGGKEIKHTGDGLMLAFESASAAINCAVKIQKSLQRYNASHEEKLHVSIGINAGEPIVENDDLFGVAVQLAARLCDSADGGEILVSEVVHLLLAGKRYDFTELEPLRLKGIHHPVRAYKAAW